MVLSILAHERKFFEQNVPTGGIPRPAATGYLKRFPRELFSSHLGDREVRNVGQFLRTAQRLLAIETFVKVLHLHRSVCHADEDRSGYWNERFHFSQTDFEWLNLAANSFQFVNCAALAVGQRTRRKDSEMGCHMRQFRMQLPAESLDKLPNRFPYVGHQGVTRT